MPELGARLVVVGLLAVLFALAPLAWRRRQTRLRRGPDSHPRVPAMLLEGAARTWVVFTTPFCASCGPAADRLRAADPGARVVTVDAARDRDLAGAFQIRAAPTLLLADSRGEVQARLVGVEALDAYLLTTST